MWKVLMVTVALVAKTFGDNYTFPNGFIFGVSTSSQQIEGGWNDDGRGPSIWDTFTHEHPDYIVDHSTSDVTTDSYHLYKEDVRILKELGVHFYRFSISWPRILPTGLANQINQPGIDYYNNLIDELLANGIQPVVTMYHWDLPQDLQDFGGLANSTIVDYFEAYARILFTNFGDRVKWWITFNEPAVVASGYESCPNVAPCVNSTGVGNYLVAHNILLAHARVYHLYDDEFRSEQEGKISITLNIQWYEPLTESEEDAAAAERALQFNLGLYAHPIYSEDGDYPAIVKERVAKNSADEGFPESRLQTFTQEEIEYIKGTHDFFGVNHYSTLMTTDGESGVIPSFQHDIGVVTREVEEEEGSASFSKMVVPWGFRNLLVWITEEYNKPPIFVTENGYYDEGGLEDDQRITYILSYLGEMLEAIYYHGSDVIGYSVWSLMDNWEWNMGYTRKFGLYSVDFNDTARTRTRKHSAEIYAEIIKLHQIPY